MSGLPPTYNEATSPYPSAPGQPTAPPVSYPEKSPYPPDQYAGYPPQSQVPYPQSPYPPTQPQGPYPPYPQPGQPQGYPPQGYPSQGYPPQGYPPQGGYPPQQAPQVPPAPPTTTNVTVVTQQPGRRVYYTGASSSFTGVLIYSAIAILCFFPIGIPAFLVALCAYSEFSKGEYPKAIGLSRLASGLATTSFIIGVIIIILSFSVRYTVF